MSRSDPLSRSVPRAPDAPESPIAARYREVRAATLRLCEPLRVEDYVVQSMPDASPVKWHLAHVSWFFETFVLKPFLEEYVGSPGTELEFAL